MFMRFHYFCVCAALVATASLLGSSAQSQVANDNKIELAGGKVILTAPSSWKKEQPKSGIVEYEFSTPSDAKQGEPVARITVMGAGGSIEDNIQRWYGQFEQPDGKPTKDKAKADKFEVDGQTIHWVDIPGSFKDTMGAGPFSGAKPVLREDYRMLGAIIVTKDGGQYFIKATGPSDVIDGTAESFKKMLKELDVKQ
jgi:hypothetical protein